MITLWALDASKHKSTYTWRLSSKCFGVLAVVSPMPNSLTLQRRQTTVQSRLRLIPLTLTSLTSRICTETRYEKCERTRPTPIALFSAQPDSHLTVGKAITNSVIDCHLGDLRFKQSKIRPHYKTDFMNPTAIQLLQSVHWTVCASVQALKGTD